MTLGARQLACLLSYLRGAAHLTGLALCIGKLSRNAFASLVHAVEHGSMQRLRVLSLSLKPGSTSKPDQGTLDVLTDACRRRQIVLSCRDLVLSC